MNLLLTGFLALFVELVLIRWMGSNIYGVSFFSNFILLACFLGLGIGFLNTNPHRTLFTYFSPGLALLLLMSYYFSFQYHIHLDPKIDDLNFDMPPFISSLIPVELTLPLIFISTMLVMMALGNSMAHQFKTHPPIRAYQLDILGSLCGILCFTLLAFFDHSPFWWGTIITSICILLYYPSWSCWRLTTWIQIISLVLIMAVCHREAFHQKHTWSPYYKITTAPYTHNRHAIIVNGMPQQFVESVEQKKHYKPFYFNPYLHRGSNLPLDRVLIIGAGTGGDVAVALAQGAKAVDAVEIDPVLYQLGIALHPDKPYHDPRVHTYIQDGRTFLQQTPYLYDLIIFALPDSLMTLSSISTIKLENYLFTQESIQKAYSHLTETGSLAMYNYYRERWMIDRLANTMNSVFKHVPCLDSEGRKTHWLAVLSSHKSNSAEGCSTLWSNQTDPAISAPITDDKPFLYIEKHAISPIYIVALLFVLSIAFLSFKLSGYPYSTILRHFDFFLMGCAFLLLEAKSITMYALLFGSTWLVNALVFSGVLFSIYCTTIITKRWHTPSLIIVYSALVFSLGMAWLIPHDLLLSLAPMPRFIAATLVYFTPIFIANYLFSTQFSLTTHATETFAVNLLGAVAGGLLEYSSVLIGYQNLLLLAAMCYFTAFFYAKYNIKNVFYFS